jgi:hypothetical protein
MASRGLPKQDGMMKKNNLIRMAITTVVLLSVERSFAVTIPAGTTLVVQTLLTINSVDYPGRSVPSQLEKDVVVNGKTVLPAGTKFSGKIETSKASIASKKTLTVNLTEVQTGGRAVPVKTTGACRLENPRYTSRRGVTVSTYSYQVPAGARMEFRLAQPLNL